jgi:hypothetical protein
MWRLLLPVFITIALGTVGLYFVSANYGPIPIWAMAVAAIAGIGMIWAIPSIIVRLKK